MLSLSFLPAASKDLIAIHDWYEEQKTGLGKQFTAEAVHQIEELRKNVTIHRFFFDNLRYVKLKRFPFSVFYFFDVITRKL